MAFATHVVPAGALRAGLTASAVVAFAFALAAPAQGQWAWKDDNGRMVYSDSPPPPGIKPGAITRQPTMIMPAPAAPATAAPDAASGAAPPAAPVPAPQASTDANAKAPAAAPKSIAEQELEFKKRQQAKDAAEKKAADEQAKAQQQSAECERMKGYIHSLESGMRISRTDADGNPHFLDDSERAAELQRSKDNASKTCSS